MISYNPPPNHQFSDLVTMNVKKIKDKRLFKLNMSFVARDSTGSSERGVYLLNVYY